MNGIDLEQFLRIVQTDFAVWLFLILTLLLMVLAIWAGAGTHKALRKCLVLSVVAHVLLVRYGHPVEWTRSGLGALATSLEQGPDEAQPLPPGIRSLEILDIQSINSAASGFGSNQQGSKTGSGRGAARGILPGEIPENLPEINTAGTRPERPVAPIAEIALNERPKQEALALPSAAIAQSLPTTAPKPEERPATASVKPAGPEPAQAQGPTGISEQERRQSLGNTVAKPAVPRVSTPLPTPGIERRTVRPESVAANSAAVTPDRPKENRPEVKLPSVDIAANITSALPARPAMEARLSLPIASPDLSKSFSTPKPAEELAPAVPILEKAAVAAATGEKPGPSNTASDKPEPNGRAALSAKSASAPPLPDTDLRSRIRSSDNKPVTEIAAVVPTARPEIALPKADLSQLAGPSSLAESRSRPSARSLDEIPLVYRTRLDPNRAKLALKAGASGESEKSVEMALEWLRKHQDSDGRWDGGVAKYRDGTIAPNEESFTVHCPPGDICFGECYYWEADTALTGLSLLAYLGAGYTHTDGKYADTVARGLDFLIRNQRPDGDLRGRSVAVGMYCHAMASLAICEAFALTGDERLKKPAASAIQFLVDSQAQGGAAWRYEPKAPVGDTSILGWVVLALRSGRSMGFNVPDNCIQGIQAWLDGVQSGKSGGLSKYQPWKDVTPTMTAEAWVCRFFLNLDANPKRSRESADYLLEHGPDRDPYNLYYWYYGTLSMYQQGGGDWEKWNSLVRDRIVRKQKTKGHQAGSWDPDDSSWGTYGGRIYCTALATLSLEVYYRFLRLYDEPPAGK